MNTTEHTTTIRHLLLQEELLDRKWCLQTQQCTNDTWTRLCNSYHPTEEAAREFAKLNGLEITTLE